MSPVTTSEFGLHLIKVTGRTPPEPRGDAEHRLDSIVNECRWLSPSERPVASQRQEAALPPLIDLLDGGEAAVLEEDL